MLRVVTPNVTGATSKMPNVYAGCYGATGLAPQEGVCAKKRSLHLYLNQDQIKPIQGNLHWFKP